MESIPFESWLEARARRVLRAAEARMEEEEYAVEKMQIRLMRGDASGVGLWLLGLRVSRLWKAQLGVLEASLGVQRVLPEVSRSCLHGG
jgi:hypothetical protein